MDLTILDIKYKLNKLEVQVEDSIRKTTNNQLREQREETIATIKDTLRLVNGLQSSLSDATTKSRALESYIQDITMSKTESK